jgi:hypothetical protein
VPFRNPIRPLKVRTLMTTRKAGEMVALCTEDGEVYVGFVTHVSDQGTFDSDLIADHTYRSSGNRCIKLADA